jgi:hypothetical protein
MILSIQPANSIQCCLDAETGFMLLSWYGVSLKLKQKRSGSVVLQYALFEPIFDPLCISSDSPFELPFYESRTVRPTQSPYPGFVMFAKRYQIASPTLHISRSVFICIKMLWHGGWYFAGLAVRDSRQLPSDLQLERLGSSLQTCSWGRAGSSFQTSSWGDLIDPLRPVVGVT